jgi:CRISPR/Cas system-associated exonuclease Cas4 (RecB family)
MEQEETRKLSVSQVKMFQRCPMQWYFRYIQGLKVPPKSALIIGSGVHAGQENIYKSKMVDGKYNETETLDCTAEYVETADKREEIDWDKPKGEVKDLAVLLVRTYIGEKIPDQIEQEDIESVEKGFSVDFETDVVAFEMIGFTDLELKDKIIDFKTTGRTPKVLDPADLLQTSLYSTAKQKDKVEVQYLVKLKTPKVVILPGPEDMTLLKDLTNKAILRTYIALENAVKTGSFEPSGITHPWACGMCGYGEKGLCKYHKFRLAG